MYAGATKFYCSSEQSLDSMEVELGVAVQAASTSRGVGCQDTVGTYHFAVAMLIFARSNDEVLAKGIESVHVVARRRTGLWNEPRPHLLDEDAIAKALRFFDIARCSSPGHSERRLDLLSRLSRMPMPSDVVAKR